MKNHIKFGFLAATIALSSLSVKAQMTLKGQIFTRSEYRHGFQTLADSAQDPAFFTSQRSRLSFGYTNEKYKVGFAAQDIRTWGSTGNLPIDVSGFLSVQEAWGEYLFNKSFSLKAGRQTLAYDDDRILGSLDWAMQGRRHDLALFKFTDSTLQIHAGLAFNQDKEQSKTTVYSITGNYKTMQFLWANKQMGKLGISLLILNNGLQFTETDTAGVSKYSTIYSQTSGTRITYKADKFFFNSNVYYQSGKDAAKKDLSAYNILAELGFKANSIIAITLGYEQLSGTSQIDTANKSNNSFAPLYGTNHKYNGFMDYFYVGNHANNVGLQDIYLKLGYKKDKIFASLDPHIFMTAADLKNKSVTTELKAADPYLGTEIDLTLGYNFTKGFTMIGGYSHMLGSESMEMLKGGKLEETSNWAYLMLKFTPDFLAK